MVCGGSTAAVGSAVFFVVAPGIVAGLVPWLINGGWDVRWPLSAFGVAIVVLGGVCWQWRSWC